ncbi:M23 family metallopeptidase [Sphingomonas xanthus]|nr:M23 family metallopeptidase [Sphingomonas xanthus]
MPAHLRTRRGLAAGTATVPGFGRRRPRWRDIDLIVDLSDDMFTRRWWRGFATLTGLCVAVALIAPQPFEPLPAMATDRVGASEAAEFREAAIAPIARGSGTGGRMAANRLVQPLLRAPDRPAIELFVRLGSGDTLDRLLARNSANYADASEAARLIASAGGRIAPGTTIDIRLGPKQPGGTRPIQRVALRAGIGLDLLVGRSGDRLSLETKRTAVDRTPLRIRGRVGDGLYWALRSAGVSPQAASDYLRALATRIDVGSDVGPNDRFDLVIANARTAGGESREGPLLYAAVDRLGGGAIRLVKWTAAGRTEWVDAQGERQRQSALAWPVAGRITSGFGLRVHPILRFARMHRGIDFGAPSGAPIVAAADGQVIRSGWAGGYGRQIRLAHDGGLSTSYSHLSRLVVEEGSFVRQGQLIGYVGSSGLSTGPHLHYEVYRGGVAINPVGVRFAGAAVIDPREQDRFKAHVARLMAVGSPRG